MPKECLTIDNIFLTHRDYLQTLPRTDGSIGIGQRQWAVWFASIEFFSCSD